MAERMKNLKGVCFWVGVIGLLVLLPVGCGGGGGSGGESGSFQVSFTSPATPFRFPLPGEAGFAGNSVITMEFSDPADRASILSETSVNGLSTSVRFTNVAGIRVPAQAFLGGTDVKGNAPDSMELDFSEDDGKTLRIVADTDDDLSTFESFGVLNDPNSQQVTVVVGQGARSQGGSDLVRGFCATYYVGLSTPNPGPRVISINPPDSATNVALDQVITITFSEEIDPLSVIGMPGDITTPTNIRLRGRQLTSGMGSNGVPPRLLSGTITQKFPGDNCTYIYTPDAPFPGQTVVQVSAVGLAPLDPNEVPPPPTDPQPIRDMLGEGMPFSTSTFYQTRPGPIIANNPTPPFTIYFGAMNPNRFGVIAHNAIEDQLGSTQGRETIDVDGDGVANRNEAPVVFPNSENTESIGNVADIEIGNVISLTSVVQNDPSCNPLTLGFTITGNSMDNPPLPNPPPIPALNSTSNCVASLCSTLFGSFPAVRPFLSNADLGNFVYVADDVNNVIHVINSTTSLPIVQIPTPDPTGLAVDPDMTFLYCTNFTANTLSVIDIRRGSQTLHQVVREVPVGLGPRQVTYQPDGEDILVCNQTGNSVTVLDAASLRVRKTLGSLIGPTPWDITSTYRGSTGTYFAFITNRDGNSVSVFESGPSTPLFFGPDDVVATFSEGPVAPFESPLGIISNKSLRLGYPVFDAPGCIFVCNGNRSLAEIQLTAFQGPPLPNFPSPGELRTFRTVLQTDPLSPNNPIGLGPVDLATNDNFGACIYFTTSNTKAWHRFQPPNPNLLNECNKIYVANRASGTVSVVNRNSGLLQQVIDIPGVSLLEGFFK